MVEPIDVYKSDVYKSDVYSYKSDLYKSDVYNDLYKSDLYKSDLYKSDKRDKHDSTRRNRRYVKCYPNCVIFSTQVFPNNFAWLSHFIGLSEGKSFPCTISYHVDFITFSVWHGPCIHTTTNVTNASPDGPDLDVSRDSIIPSFFEIRIHVLRLLFGKSTEGRMR
jgi:hypothetical protein